MLTNANSFQFIFCKCKIRNKLTLSRTHRWSSGYNMVIFSNGTIMKSVVDVHSSFLQKFLHGLLASALNFVSRKNKNGWQRGLIVHIGLYRGTVSGWYIGPFIGPFIGQFRTVHRTISDRTSDRTSDGYRAVHRTVPRTISGRTSDGYRTVPRTVVFYFHFYFGSI